MFLPHDFSFVSPRSWYMLLLVIPVVVLIYRTGVIRSSVLDLFGRAGRKVIISRDTFYSRLRAVLLVSSLVMAVIALAGPAGNFHSPESSWELIEGKEGDKLLVKEKLHDVIFLLDASASMTVPDARVGGSRFEFAKEIIEEITSKLRGENVSLYAFTSQLTTVVPSTPDTLFLRLVLNQVKINEGDVAGTDLVQALDELNHRQLSKGTGKLVTLILFSDGGDTKLEGLTGEARDQQVNLILSRLEEAKRHRFQMFTIGLGTPAGEIVPGITYEGNPVKSSLDEDLLQKLARVGGGRYFFANNYTSLGIAENISAAIVERETEADVKEEGIEIQGQLKRKEGSRLVFDRYFQIPLAIAILFLGIALFLPQARKVTLVLILLLQVVPIGGQAASSETTQIMKQSEVYFNSEHPEKGEPLLRGLLAKKGISNDDRLLINYNLAQILIKEGRWEEALQLLEQVANDAPPNFSMQMEASRAVAELAYPKAVEFGEQEDYEKGLELISTASVHIERVVELKEQFIAVGIGQSDLQKAIAMQNEIKRVFVDFLIKNEAQKIQKTPVQTLGKGELNVLKKAMEEIQSLKELVKNPGGSSNLEQELDWRLDRLGAFLERKDDVWKGLHDRVEKEEKKEYFYSAEKNRMEAIESMHSGQLQSAGDELNLAIVNLETFLAEKKNDEPPSSKNKDQQNSEQDKQEQEKEEQQQEKDERQENAKEEEKDSEQTKEEQQKKKEEQKQIRQILEELQRMNEQDQKPQEGKSPVRGGVRPW